MIHTQHPVTRAEFARRAGRARSRITEACGPDGALQAACLAGGSIDAAHPVVQAWAVARRIDPLALLEQSPAREPAPPSVEELVRQLILETAQAIAAQTAAAVRGGAGAVELRALVHQLADDAFEDARRRLVVGLALEPTSP